MKRMIMAIMAVGVAVTFSAPAFAGEEKKDKKDEIWSDVLMGQGGVKVQK